jgi:hypoxanthine phosphoribosyltransferase
MIDVNYKTLISVNDLQKRIKELGSQISLDYKGLEPIIIGVLRGSVVFLADLAREITINAYFDFMVVTRYGYKETGGQIRFLKDLDSSIEGKNVLIVEDIIDEGITLYCLKNELLKRKPASLKICSLLDKPANRSVDLTADYTGFVIEDKFVVGYGMDCKQRYRNIPYIAMMAN